MFCARALWPLAASSMLSRNLGGFPLEIVPPVDVYIRILPLSGQAVCSLATERERIFRHPSRKSWPTYVESRVASLHRSQPRNWKNANLLGTHRSRGSMKSGPPLPKSHGRSILDSGASATHRPKEWKSCDAAWKRKRLVGKRLPPPRLDVSAATYSRALHSPCCRAAGTTVSSHRSNEWILAVAR